MDVDPLVQRGLDILSYRYLLPIQPTDNIHVVFSLDISHKRTFQTSFPT